MSATTDQELAELRRANAELLKGRDAALAALAQRNTEYGERIEHQSATIDVLKAMSNSPGDPQPVFDLIVEHARLFCGADTAGIALAIDRSLHLRAHRGFHGEHAAAYEASFPRPVDTDTTFGRTVLARDVQQIPDNAVDPSFALATAAQLAGIRSHVGVPLLRGEKPIGALSIARNAIGNFTQAQVVLLQTFAEQAVIAITSAETYRALQARTADLQESLNYQTAMSDVLKVISRSTFDVEPVLNTLVETAAKLCDAEMSLINRRDGDRIWAAANYGYPSEVWEYWKATEPFPPDPDAVTVGMRTLLEGRVVHIHDVTAVPGYPPQHIALGKQRTTLGVPLLRAGEVIGNIGLSRQRVEPFTDRQIALLENFAAQAVIAIENTRLLTEQREALEQQTATAEVLQVINTSPGDLAPVFDAMLEKALRLCEAAFGALVSHDGECFHTVAQRGLPARYVEYLATTTDQPGPGGGQQRVLQGEKVVQFVDMKDDEAYRSGSNPAHRAMVDIGGARTGLIVPLRKESVLVGTFTIYRQEVRPFSDKQIALLQNFAAQAVIAMENARLLNEVRQRQEELRITFENMGDGVAMFDETQLLVAWNSKFQEVFDLPHDLLQQHRTYEEYLRFLAQRGDFGADVDTAEHIAELVATTGQPYGYERTRPDGRVIEIRRNPVPDGGFVLIFSDITERKRSEVEIRAARDLAEAAYRDLKAAQASLIQAEKMASLGQLTAGIAHEIKNPLNFVNNFAELSGDMLDELNEAVANNRQAEVDELTETLKANLAKIAEHGRRADGIVRGMLEHSRGSSGERREVDPNALVDEALNLAYHGARAQDQSFNVTLHREFGEGIAPITVAPQDLTRVLLNLFSNGFYAARERQRTEATSGFEPTLQVSTSDVDGAVEIRVRDNGIGIPAEIKDRLFQPFFTTKPPGEGTGLGLSMSYDIITQQHGGSISVDSKVGEYSEFTVRLPRSP